MVQRLRAHADERSLSKWRPMSLRVGEGGCSIFASRPTSWGVLKCKSQLSRDPAVRATAGRNPYPAGHPARAPMLAPRTASGALGVSASDQVRRPVGAKDMRPAREAHDAPSGSLALGLLIQKLPEPSRHQTDAIATRDVDLDHRKTGPFEARLQPARQLIENRQRLGPLEVAETTPPLALSFFHIHVGDLDLSRPGSRANKIQSLLQAARPVNVSPSIANLRTRIAITASSLAANPMSESTFRTCPTMPAGRPVRRRSGPVRGAVGRSTRAHGWLMFVANAADDHRSPLVTGDSQV